MNLFTEQINGKKDWERVFESIPAFAPLVEYILSKESLPVAELKSLTPGTNFVTRAGDYVVKVFAPEESRYKQEFDFQSEIFATNRAFDLGVPTPKIIASGLIEDKYSFDYIITEFIEGIELENVLGNKTDAEKTNIGKRLRFMTDKMNLPCAPFNEADPINDESNDWSWEKYPERFKTERHEYIRSYAYGEKVLVHGDLCSDNILITPKGDLYLIDFADAVLAPIEYEHALVAIGLFDLDTAFLRGYFSGYTVDEMLEVCFSGILIQGYGGEDLPWHVGKPHEFQCLEDLRVRLKARLEDNVPRRAQ